MGARMWLVEAPSVIAEACPHIKHPCHYDYAPCTWRERERDLTAQGGDVDDPAPCDRACCGQRRPCSGRKEGGARGRVVVDARDAAGGNCKGHAEEDGGLNVCGAYAQHGVEGAREDGRDELGEDHPHFQYGDGLGRAPGPKDVVHEAVGGGVHEKAHEGHEAQGRVPRELCLVHGRI